MSDHSRLILEVRLKVASFGFVSTGFDAAKIHIAAWEYKDKYLCLLSYFFKKSSGNIENQIFRINLFEFK